MISITRCDAPENFGRSVAKEKWKLKTVVSALWAMQKEKCCYCETYIPIKGHAKAVEHFHPRDVFNWKANEWNNLLLACSQCNGAKSNKFPVQLTEDDKDIKIVYLTVAEDGKKIDPLLINPSDGDIDPEYYITFVVDSREEVKEFGVPKARSGRRRGRYTIETLDLDSQYNVKRRRKLLRQTLVPIYEGLLDADVEGNADKLERQKDLFIGLMSSKSEFSAFVREFAHHYRLDRYVEIPSGA